MKPLLFAPLALVIFVAPAAAATLRVEISNTSTAPIRGIGLENYVLGKKYADRELPLASPIAPGERRVVEVESDASGAEQDRLTWRWDAVGSCTGGAVLPVAKAQAADPACPGGLTPAQTDADGLDKARSLADHAQTRGDGTSLVRHLQQMLKFEPDNREALTRLGQSYLDWKKPAEALPFLDAGVTAWGDDSELRQLRAEAHLGLKHPGPALADLQHALPFVTQDEGKAWVHSRMAYAHVLANNYDIAYSEMNEVVALVPDNTEALMQRAVVGCYVKKWAETARDEKKLRELGKPVAQPCAIPAGAGS